MKASIAPVAFAALVLLLAAGCIFPQQTRLPMKPLLEAAQNGRLDRVKQCLETSGDANVTDESGNTALMMAVVGDHVDVIEYLLSHGANPWLKNEAGETALDIAKMAGLPNRSVKVLEDDMRPPKVTWFLDVHAPGKPGFVTSPYAPESGYVDVSKYRVGECIRDPYTGRVFIVPPRNVFIGIVPGDQH